MLQEIFSTEIFISMGFFILLCFFAFPRKFKIAGTAAWIIAGLTGVMFFVGSHSAPPYMAKCPECLEHFHNDQVLAFQISAIFAAGFLGATMRSIYNNYGIAPKKQFNKVLSHGDE